jgi:hypothetical protein
MKAADAAGLIASQFPHLVSVLSPQQMEAVQTVLSARRRIGQLRAEMAPYEGSHASDDVRKRTAIEERIDAEAELVSANEKLLVPTQQLLADDVLAPGQKNPEMRLFHDRLYRKMISAPTRLVVQEGVAPRPLFALYWGADGRTKIGNDGGRITFAHLMRWDQQLSAAWLSASMGQAIEKLGKMEELHREMGGALYLMEGKKVGEIYHSVRWNTSVRVGEEVGRRGGYYDDTRGLIEVGLAAAQVKGAHIILKAPDRWLHLYRLNPATLKAWDLTSPDNDGYVYVLGKGSQAGQVVLIKTADRFELEPGATKAGSGWRLKEDPSKPGAFIQGAVGGFFGDWVDDPSFESGFGQVIVGLIPVVGQIADARDVAAGIHKMWKTGGKDGKLQTALAIVGLVPLLGDSIKWAVNRRNFKAAQKAIDDAAPRIRSVLKKELEEDAARVASRFGVDPSTFATARKSLAELLEQGAKGGDAATNYAKRMTEVFEEVGGNVPALVAISGGTWVQVVKALLADKTGAGRRLSQKMQSWRVKFFDVDVKGAVATRASSVDPSLTAAGVKAGPPEYLRTGSPGAVHDIDISFLGPNSTMHRNIATQFVEESFGKDWRRLFDAEIMTDPLRIHIFDTLGGKTARAVESKMVKESELNVLAKMIKDGVEPEDVLRFAAKIRVSPKQLVKRAEEIAELASNPTLYRRMELEMDNLHARILSETNPRVKAKLAEEMVIKQAKLNAAVKGPYMTPAGVAKHVTLRENVGGARAKSSKPLSPAMGYMLFLDDHYMVEAVLATVKRERKFTGETAKAMSKYADRLLLTAGQYGVDFSKAKRARVLFETIEGLLGAAKRDPQFVARHFSKYLHEARTLLTEQIDDLLVAVRRGAVQPGAADYAAKAVELLKRQDATIKALSVLGSVYAEASKEIKGARQAATEPPH